MDREGALRILGLDASATEAERVAAYWRVRAHVETRLEEATDDVLRARRHGELEDLKSAVELLAGASAPQTSRPPPQPLREFPLPPARWLIAWSVIATAMVGALLVGLVYLLARGGPPGGDSPAQEGPRAARWQESASMPAQQSPPAAAPDAALPSSALTVTANLEGAGLVVEALDSGEVVAEGPADGTRLELQPGNYRLLVQHPECSDPWKREISLAAGESRAMLARNCADLAWLVVRSNVSGDRLEIDGEEIGATGPTRHALATGEHEVRVSSDGFVPWVGMVTLPAAQELTLRAILQADSCGEEAGSPQESREQSQSEQMAAQQAAGGGGDPAEQRPLVPPEWLERATHYLLSRYDFDRSGALDSVEEVEAIPCNDWLAFERSLDASHLGLPLTRLYGFDGSDWVEGAFGIEGGLRHAAYLHMKECGLR